MRRCQLYAVSQLCYHCCCTPYCLPTANLSTWLSINPSRHESRADIWDRSCSWATYMYTPARPYVERTPRRALTLHPIHRPPWSTENKTRGGKVRRGGTSSTSWVLPSTLKPRSPSTCSRFVSPFMRQPEPIRRVFVNCIMMTNNSIRPYTIESSAPLWRCWYFGAIYKYYDLLSCLLTDAPAPKLRD